MSIKSILEKGIFVLILAFSLNSAAQSSVTVSGKITEAASGENMFGTELIFKSKADESTRGTTTNEYGFYSITLPPGTYVVRSSYIGFKAIEETLDVTADLKKNFSLEADTQKLSEVVVTGQTDERTSIAKAEMSKNVLPTAKIAQMPTPLGVPDVLQTLVLLPGVTNTGEISNGFNVRGGGVDQNLVLLDESILFTTSHLFGLLSAFNPMALKDITLYKGGIPARYGGRISSVLDVYQKEGSKKSLEGELTLGLLASSGVIHGPIKKDKASFLVAGRLSPLTVVNPNGGTGSSIWFYDLNTKLSYNLNENNSLYLSGYFGRDIVKIRDIVDNGYGNALVNARWNHIFGSKLFSNLSLIYSAYDFSVGIRVAGFQWKNSIQNINLKYSLRHYLSEKTKLYYGLDNIYYIFNPGTISSFGGQSVFSIDTRSLTKKYANELALYIGSEQKIGNKLQIDYGLRLSRFDRFSQVINTYATTPVVYDPSTKVYQQATPTGTKNSGVTSYMNLEPRLAISYVLNEESSIKASYNRMAQYLQVISNNSSPNPSDIWAPAGTFIKPMVLDQVSAGYFRNIGEKYALEVEGFYKDVKNKVDYISGANLFGNNAIETEILNGIARSYGLELLFRKDKGRLTGWISYTLSKSEQQVKGRTPEEVGINNGNWYNAPQDKTHNIAITGNYKLSNSFSLNANFIFQTGRAVTFPVGQYTYFGYTVPEYSVRNSDRLPAYHRLDIGVLYDPIKNRTRRRQVQWSFSIYNLYNRKNPYSISYSNSNGSNISEMTYIYGILPSINCNIKF